MTDDSDDDYPAKQQLIDATDDLLEDFVAYITACMDEPNRASIVRAEAALARIRGETP